MATTLFRSGERRRIPRHQAWQPVTLAGPGLREREPATLLDISGAGALLKLAPGQHAPRTLGIRLRLTGKEDILTATVLTTEPSWNGDLVHVRFDALTPALADALSAFLAEREAPAVRTEPAAVSARVIPFRPR